MIVSSCRVVGITLDAMTCLSRRDPDKDIFKKVKKQQKSKRRNFYNMVDIDLKKRMLECQKERYPLDDVCTFSSLSQSRNCTLDNTNNEIVELNYRDKYGFHW